MLTRRELLRKTGRLVTYPGPAAESCNGSCLDQSASVAATRSLWTHAGIPADTPASLGIRRS